MTSDPTSLPNSECLMFVIPGPPVSKLRHRHGKHGSYTPAKTKTFEQVVGFVARQAMGGRELFDGPLVLDVLFKLQIPKSWSNKRKQLALDGLVMPTGKPDLDNLVKAIKDALNNIVYHDDAAIVNLFAGKRYAANPSTLVTVRRCKHNTIL